MPLDPGTRLGHYEVVSSIGAGGMGEIYRARDTKLERDVAIKVLPEAFADAPDRLARFEREAKLLASLNHPHIAAIHGLEEVDAIRFLVLELVPGDTLFERLQKGPIPLEETLRLAKQIAEALEAAHGKGVIHRDLKPANVKETPDGQIKVLDFGLAKAFDEEPADGVTSNSPTLSAPSTRVGMILGTAAYMSPEQARGIPVDKRSDIFSFGSLVFEMLTGRKTFPGEFVSDTLASVIKSDPDWSGLPPDVPPRLRELLRRCLEKDPNKRRRDIGDVRIEIEEIVAGADALADVVAAPKQALPLWRRALPVALALAAGIVLGVVVSIRPEPANPVLRYSIPLPEDVSFSSTGRHIVAISPDGKRLAHTGNSQLYLREMDQMEAVPVRGTEGGGGTSGRSPFFSPDGEWLGFWAEGKLKKVTVSGGAPVTLCDAGNPYGASWTEENTIVYGQGSDGIWQVSANGGEPELLVELEESELAHGPQLLPGGKAILFTLAGSSNWDDARTRIVAHSLDTGERRVLIEGGSNARYLPTGHIVYALGATLFAVPFDVRSLELTGGPVSVLDEVRRAGNFTGAAQFSLSRSGTLLYVPGGAEGASELVWIDRNGQRAPVTDRRSLYRWPCISPDGRRLAVEIGTSEGNDIWILDLERDTSSRLTVGGQSRSPVWSPDGEWVAFRSNRSGTFSVYQRRADFSGEAELLLEDEEDLYLQDWSRDGWLLYMVRGEPGDWDIWAQTLDGSEEPRPVVQSGFRDAEPSFSPDGRWVVYMSDASGTLEIYVTPFPDSGRRYQISPAGGLDPVWSPQADQIFYTSEGRTWLAVDVTADPEFRAGSPRELFEAEDYVRIPGRDFDVARDEQGFVVVVGSSSDAAQEMHVVVNSFEELKKRVPVE